MDVNGIGFVSPVDALAIINYLNQQAKLIRPSASTPVPAPAPLPAVALAPMPSATDEITADRVASDPQSSSSRSSSVDLLMLTGITPDDLLSSPTSATNPLSSKSRARRIDELFAEW